MTDTFWGLTATAWSAFAAAGAFFAALVSAVGTWWTLQVGDARPKVTLRLGSLLDYAVTTSTLRAWPNRPPSMRDKGLQVVEVTVANRGRTPMTVVAPRIIKGLPVREARHWWLKLRRFEQSVTLRALPWDGYEHGDSVRIEPFAHVRYLLDLSPFFRERHPDLPNQRPWKVLRIVVDVPGRKAVRARGAIEAHPGIPQLGGEPVTLEQFLYRWFLLRALQQERHHTESSWPDKASASFYAELIQDAVEKADSPITGGMIQRALAPFETSQRDTASLSFELAMAAAEAGFTTYNALSTDRPQRGHAPALPPSSPISRTRRQRLGKKIAELGRRVAGFTTPTAD